jgi:hypothetical protein
MPNTEKTIDNVWVLDDQNRLLSRGGLCFRYSTVGKIFDERSGWTRITWEKLLPSGTWIPVTDTDTIDALNDALRVRLARLEDGPHRKVRAAP